MVRAGARWLGAPDGTPDFHHQIVKYRSEAWARQRLGRIQERPPGEIWYRWPRNERGPTDQPAPGCNLIDIRGILTDIRGARNGATRHR
jgi:hypothetical protein